MKFVTTLPTHAGLVFGCDGACQLLPPLARRFAAAYNARVRSCPMTGQLDYPPANFFFKQREPAMLASLALLSLLAAADAADAAAAKMPWKDVRPVTMVVLDSNTQMPIRKFSYTYKINTPTAKYDPGLAGPVTVQSDIGTFQLMAPESCEIELVVTGENIIGGFGTWRTYDLTSANKLRRIEVLVRTGVVITGTVVDARAGKPIAGALVSPIIFTPPLFTPDRNRAVKTDTAGKFTVSGVEYDMGVNVWHSEYLEFNHGGFEKIGENLYATEIRLETGERLVGVVREPGGRPLAGVKVSDGADKETQTGKDGSFVLASPRKWGGEDTYNLSFEKDGYLSQDQHPRSAEPEGFSVVLQPVPVLAGQVLDPQGKPLDDYFVAAGVTLEPQSWRCSSKQVHDPAGRFSLPVRTDRDYEHTGKVWIGVKAAGYAFWDTTVEIEGLRQPVTARLVPGVTVRGSLASPKRPSEKVTATLLPVRIHKEDFTRETSYRQELGRMEAVVAAGGEFHFEHVGPGTYVLAIAGPAISPMSTSIVVASSDLDAGRFALRGRGSIAGIIYEGKMICEGDKCRLDEKRGPWPFAEGHISFQDSAGRSNSGDFRHLEPIPFKADEGGRFCVDGVPVGMVSVEIPHHITADIIGAHVRRALVLEGRKTDVRFFDTSGQWEALCQFQVGDGSTAQFSSGTGLGARRKVENVTTRPPMFEVQLHPIGEIPASFEAHDWAEPDPRRQILLRDVHPGKYRLTVNDWLMSRGLYGSLYEAAVEAKEGKTVWTIPLGAGCITGAVQWSKPYRYMVHVIAVGKRSGTVRNAYCDDQGNFCLRYLPEDDYMLRAHDDQAGWCAMPGVTVRNNITDIGSHKLAAGGTISGKVPPRLQGDAAVTVVATDAHGIAIEDPHGWDPIGDRFRISSLWPARWVVTLKRGDHAIARQTVTLQGTETVTAELAKAKETEKQ
jgi:hypothetical protein